MCFNFSNLSTNNPQRKLKRVSNKYIDFQGNDECFVVFNSFRVHWNNRHKAGYILFTWSSLKKTVR